MDLLNLAVRIFAQDEASDAVDDVSQNIVGKLGSAAATAAKAIAGAFAVKKVVDFGKASYAAYSQFEQLQGGVKKLFGEIDSQTVMQNASRAFGDMGLSANEYMSQVTSFSAALISDLEGDTAKAADAANVAMTSMADNVSIFGSDIQSVQYAYQGFAKQNYTMLDNLKLGYGGTKTEMERLIDDANKYASSIGKASDLSIDSFADVVEAIDLIQQKQGIAGNASAEASKTLEGSMNATKAAWQNLVTEFGKPDADIGARIADMFTAVMGKNGEGGLLRNAVGEVQTIAKNMTGAVSDGIGAGIDWISQNGPDMLGKAMDSLGDAIERGWTALLDFHTDFNLVDALFGEDGDSGIVGKVSEFFGKMGDSFAEHWPYVQDQLGMLWEEAVAAFEKFAPQLREVAGRLITMAAEGISEHGPEIDERVSKFALDGLQAIGRLAGMAVAKGAEFISGIVTGTSEEGKVLHKWFADFFPSGLLKGLGDFGTFLLEAGRSLINGLLDGIGEVAPDVEQGIRDAFQTVIDFFEGVGEFIQDPIGSIQRGFEALVGSSDESASGVEKSMGKVEGSVDRSMTSASASLQKYNGTKLRDKSATARVTGNAESGSARKAVNDTNTAVQKLKDKSVSVDVKGNVTSGVAGGSIRTALDLIGKMKDKSVTLTTHNVTRNTKITETKQARGGIRRHARGDIFVANNPGDGVDLDVVKDVTGEAGPEAIVPLTSHYGKDFAQMMGKEAAKEMGGNGVTVNIYMTYNAGDDATKIVNDIAGGLSLVL